MTTATALGDGLHCIDLRFQGEPGVIAIYLLEDAGERALIEIGPTSTLDNLLQGLEHLGVDPESITKILATHIHLDHAGAAGTFIRRFPRARLYVHEVGAPHMIDPSKLLVSARRIYGDQMDTLWGPVEPVPEQNMHVLTDGDVVTVGNRELTVAYTPGHASHHVAYQNAARHAVFTGDVAAVRLQGYSYVRPPTPPPDVDLEAWHRSVGRLRAMQPRVLYLTHFGPFVDVESHLRAIEEGLEEWRDFLARAMEDGHDRDRLIDDLTRHGDEQIMRSTADAAALRGYELATPYYMSVDGYLRYFQRQARKAHQPA